MSTCFSCFLLAIGIMKKKYFVYIKMTYSSRYSFVACNSRYAKYSLHKDYFWKVPRVVSNHKFKQLSYKVWSRIISLGDLNESQIISYYVFRVTNNCPRYFKIINSICVCRICINLYLFLLHFLCLSFQKNEISYSEKKIWRTKISSTFFVSVML